MDVSSFGAMGYVLLGLAVASFVGICLLFFLDWMWQDEDIYCRHEHRGMKRMLVYDSPIYMYVLTFFIAVLISIVSAFLMVGVFEGLLWLSCWILKILAVIIIVVAWVAIVGGIIMVFGNPIIGILVAGAGALLLAGGRWLKEVMEEGVIWCQNLLSDVWRMSTDVVMFGYDNWKTILLIVAAPVIVTLAIAAIIIFIDLICMATESIITAMYKVHRKCPYCGNEKGFDDMNFVAHLLVAIVYLEAFVVGIQIDKKVAYIFTFAASFLLVLTGLCINVNLTLVCIVWSIVDIILMAYILALLS